MALRLRTERNESRTDKELLDEYIASGVPDILGILYGRYIYLVYGVCLKYFKNREHSQDAVMDIFEKVLAVLRTHKVINFKSWLYVLTKNYCLMELRSSDKIRRETVNIDNHEYLFMENVAELHPIDRKDDNIDKILELCIEKLKEEQKECIRLFYYDNKCYREIARKMDIDEKKVKSLLQNAKRNLRICIDGKYEGQEGSY